MNYINILLAASLVCCSINAGEAKQELAKKILSHAGSAVKTTGRVAKVGAYGALTGVSGIMTLVPVSLLAGMGIAYRVGYRGFGVNKERDEIGISLDSRDDSLVSLVPIISLAAVFASSAYGMSMLTIKLAQRTKQAVQEVKAPK